MASSQLAIHNCLNSDELRANVSSLVLSLLHVDSRIRIYPLYGDVDEDKGFFVTKDHIFFPYVLPKIEHDIAHLVELKSSRRWTLPDWGMPRFSKEDIKPGPFYAALARETRTRAIQLHLQPEKVGDMSSTVFNPLANPYWEMMACKLLPFGRFKCMQDIHCWVGHLRERTYQAWCLDRIEHEWQMRINHISNWMETAR